MSIHIFLLEAQFSFASRRSHELIVACSFPNSEKVKKFKSGRTKTSSISKFTTNENTNSLIREFRKLPFSNNSGDSHIVDAKPYPVVIAFPGADSQTISSQVLSIPILKEASTGENRVDLSIKEFEKTWHSVRALFSNGVR
ncbi:bifunctional endo-1,4-beta-xylanase xyla-like isoform x1 [Plakobranchus ocellatus]|uniref:Bifunctional endo-1,4-beta-xylanase xyla-like isoform x1 n=1 Tax=Plakobranchus ocellatus TaxID=259542 RepID=A0AAV3ZTP6_9GAST|nr:bifunctional endo-1,4-beta-xylanase xyla-like isoform x1 [Plakobranchus ocellatus]